jgi:type I restriction enzyme S subunit
MYRFRADPELVDSRYLEAFLRAPETKAQIDAMKTGISESGMNITHEKFAQLLVPLAPRPEQQHVADKLDTVLARVDACRDHLSRVAALLKRLRQSVLAAATSGRLTEEWRGPSSESWLAVQLGDLLAEKPRNGYSPKAVDYETPVRSLTLSATTQGKFKGQFSKFIDEEISPNSHLWLEPGDLLIQRANSLEYVGVCAIFDGPARTFIYPDLMMKCRPNRRTTSSFLHIVLSADGARKYFRDSATGTAGNMPKINQQTVIAVPIHLPPAHEQAEIVSRVETLFAFADRLEARLTQAQTVVDRLSPSLLAKAFRGELVPQDPADEPAAELLKRLAQSRSTTAPKIRRPRPGQPA